MTELPAYVRDAAKRIAAEAPPMSPDAVARVVVLLRAGEPQRERGAAA